MSIHIDTHTMRGCLFVDMCTYRHVQKNLADGVGESVSRLVGGSGWAGSGG